MNEATHERDAINNVQREKSASFTDQENVQEERLVFEKEVKDGADFWNYDTDVTI